jgi:hypothetical protein
MTNSAWLASAGRSYAIYAGLVVPPLAMRRTVVSTFAMNDSIVEVPMKRQWRVRRQLQSTADAERRWDRTYQHLLEWTLPSEPVSALVPPLRSASRMEARYENGSLSARVDEPSNAGADD